MHTGTDEGALPARDLDKPAETWGHGRPPYPAMPHGEYEDLMRRMAHHYAPRRFAIVQDWGRDVDGRIAAWGVAANGRTYVTEVGEDDDGGGITVLHSMSLALHAFRRLPYVTTRVLWIDPQPDA